MKKIPMAAMLALAAFTLPVSAATYYVNSDTGEDVDPKVNKKAGLSEGAAFKTIQFAIDKAAAGSTILVAPGEYEAIKSNNKKLTIKAIEGFLETSITGWNSAEELYSPVAADLGAWGTQAQYATIEQTVFSDGTKVKWWWDSEAKYPEEGWDYDAHWYSYEYHFISITPKKPKGWVGYDPPEGVTWERDWDWFGTTKTGRMEPVYKGGKNTVLVGFSLDEGQRAVWGGTLQNCEISGFGIYGSGGMYDSSGSSELYGEGGIVHMSSLTDCWVEYNDCAGYGTDGYLLASTTATRTYIEGNSYSAVLVADSTLNNCVVSHNSAVADKWGYMDAWSLIGRSTLYNCTVVENDVGYHNSYGQEVETTADDPDGYESNGKYWKWVDFDEPVKECSCALANSGNKVFNSIFYNNLSIDGLQHNVDTNAFFDTTYTYENEKGKMVTTRYDASSQFVNSCTDVLIDSSKNKKVKSTGNIAADPCFISPWDYSLAPWSPCVNAGADYQSKTGKTDMFGGPRKVGAKVDMGAYELQASTPVPADYDGDGITDAALCFADTGEWWIWGSQSAIDSGATYVYLPMPKGATPIVADFDGTGFGSQPGYFAGAEKEPFFVHLDGGIYGEPVTNSFATYKDAKGKAVSTKGATPVAARLKAGAPATFGIYASTVAAPVYVFENGLTYGGNAKILAKGSKPVIADFDGDGIDDLGAYTSSAAAPAFTVLRSDEGYSLTAPFTLAANFFYPTARQSIPLGAKGALPCVADYDGDGLADFATYSSTAATPEFTRLLSSSKYSETRTMPMGSKGDVPVVGNYENAAPAAANMAVFTGSTWRYCDSGYEDEAAVGWPALATE
ncbi:MAG: hypothetical protein ILM98_14475 [Kiritimatiellae bacterium]|nr:hypothetical protein [Kiritimatiellia bacterium]